jgi:hypothetical protein
MVETIADRETIFRFANEAHSLLYQDGHDEFGEATQIAICDLAGDNLTDAGYRYNRETLVAIARGLA